MRTDFIQFIKYKKKLKKKVNSVGLTISLVKFLFPVD